MMQRERGMTAPPRAAPRRPRRGAWIDRQSVFWYRFVRILGGLLLRYWVRCFRADGADRVPAEGGKFIVANHTSGMDPFLLGYPLSHRIILWGPGKVELFKHPVAAYVMRKIGMFPLRQGGADAAAVRTMVELYRAGKTVIIFPEGGRSETGAMKPFVPDFARLVIKLRAPLVPAAIAGARELLPIGRFVPRFRSPVAVRYGDVFELSEFYQRTLTPELASEAAQIMQERVAELLALARSERKRLKESC